MGHALRFALTAFAAAALIAGCECIDPRVEQPACELDGGCPEGLTCEQGVCRAPGGTGGGSGGSDGGTLPNGAQCFDGDECQSTHCQSGVCCDRACTGSCEECRTGTCRFADAGAEPFACGSYRCAANGTCETGCTGSGTQCQSGSTCTGGQCFGSRANGAPCVAANDCASGACADGVCCNNACTGECERCDGQGTEGQCLSLSQGSPGAGRDGGTGCAPFVCSGAASSCPGSCASNAGCAAGLYCDGGACLPSLATGQSCGGGAQCASGNCVDGICCATACGAACDGCNVSGSVGSCTVLPAATSGSPACTPYVCDGTNAGCPASCIRDSDCAAGSFCNAQACTAKLGPGASCGGGNQCSSGNCVSGICCSSPCSGACESCSTGTCTVRGAGQTGVPSCAPYLCDGVSNVCPASCDAGTQCNSDGGCQAGVCLGTKGNGGSCDAGTQCTSTRCVDGVCCDLPCAGACDACNVAGQLGNCISVPAGSAGSPSCAPFACSGASPNCPGACTADTQCTGGYFCGADAGCTPKLALAAACTAGNQCTSGFCASGVCCDASCTGNCQACNLAPTPGTCMARPAGSACTGTGGSGTCSGATCLVTRTAAADRDSRIENTGVDSSNGASNRLQVGATDYVSPAGLYRNRSLIRIPLGALFSGLNASSTVTSASLKLKTRQVSGCWSIGTAPAFFVEELSAGFTENSENRECSGSTGGTNWSTQPSATTTNRGHYSSSGVAPNTTLSVDLTAMVRAALVAGKTQLHLRLIASNSSGTAYDETNESRKLGLYSSESGDGPSLQMTFVAP